MPLHKQQNPRHEKWYEHRWRHEDLLPSWRIHLDFCAQPQTERVQEQQHDSAESSIHEHIDRRRELHREMHDAGKCLLRFSGAQAARRHGVKEIHFVGGAEHFLFEATGELLEECCAGAGNEHRQRKIEYCAERLRQRRCSKEHAVAAFALHERSDDQSQKHRAQKKAHAGERSHGADLQVLDGVRRR